jgi:uncharacterized GH25 family protein
MRRFLAAALAIPFLLQFASAHFVFVVPAADGTKAEVVFSESLEPDDAVDIAKIAGVKLTVRDAAGKTNPVVCEKGEHALKVAIPGSGSRIVFGQLDYGVVQKGEAPAFLLRYYPKTIVGPLPADGGKLGDAALLEVVPVGEAGKLRFQVLAQGKPVADASMTVLVPGEKPQVVKTDKDGFSPAFAQVGRFGVWARRVETASGESAGKKYAEVRDYATLVCDVAGK